MVITGGYCLAVDKTNDTPIAICDCFIYPIVSKVTASFTLS
jgi:hypothetical protein